MLPQQSNYINGEWSTPEDEAGWICDANTGANLQRQKQSSSKQVDAAISRLADDFQESEWSHIDVKERAAILNSIAVELDKRSEEIAYVDSITTGVLLASTRAVGKICGASFRAAANLIVGETNQTTHLENEYGQVYIQRLPRGPAAVIAPWNAPSGIACHKIASALAAGCNVLYKPSEWSPHSAQYIVQAILSTALPKNTIQLVLGDAQVGAQIVDDARIKAVSFTGGSVGGRAVGSACGYGIKPAQLELGGNNPLVVLPSADPAQAIEAIITGLVTMNAQWCRAPGRLIIHRSLYQPIIDGVSERLRQLVIGSSLDSASQMGPLVHQGHREYCQKHLDLFSRQGAKIIQLSQLPKDQNGWYFAPALVTDLDPSLTLEECFGPIVTLHAFDSVDEAIHLANQSAYGLAAYVFGSEQEALATASSIYAGVVKINAVSLFNLHPQAPRPAWGISGLHDEGTRESYEFFRASRVIGFAGEAPR